MNFSGIKHKRTARTTTNSHPGHQQAASSVLDCVYSLWYKAPTMLPAGDRFILVTSRQHRRCFIPQAVNTV